MFVGWASSGLSQVVFLGRQADRTPHLQCCDDRRNRKRVIMSLEGFIALLIGLGPERPSVDRGIVVSHGFDPSLVGGGECAAPAAG